MTDQSNSALVAVVIPCYRTRDHIMGVLNSIGPQCDLIYVVDDKCPEQTGLHVQSACTDPRVRVLFHKVNQGVGGAVMTGYRQAIADGATAIVKIDGDGQMDPALLPFFVAPILNGDADYTKGNRFFDLEGIGQMPKIRILGNAVLSFFNKFSSGYWNIFDPTNGYTGIHARVAARLPLDKISQRYFFESDILFRLNIVRAVVIDIPMTAKYGDEKSNLKISRIAFEFLFKHVVNITKRIFYNYFLRDFSVASLELIFGLAMFLFGAIFGAVHWWHSSALGQEASAGTVMLASLPVLAGIQLLLAFLGYDIGSVPVRPVHPALIRDDRSRSKAPERSETGVSV